MKKIITRLLSRKLLFVVSIVSAILFTYIIFQLKILPLKYFIPLSVIVFIIPTVLFVGANDKSHNHRIRTVLLKLIQIVFAICLIISSIIASKGSGFINSISEADKQVIQMNIIVLKESSYKKLDDLKNEKFCANTAIDPVNINKTESKIEDKINDIDVLKSDTYIDAINNLLSGKAAAMIVKDIDMTSLDDIESDFNTKVRIIGKIELTIPSAEANSAKVTQETFNVLISGADKEGPINTFALSDVDMVVTVNPQTKQILLTSIPRDYYVDIIGMSGVKGQDKLTHSAKGGMECTIKTIENLLGLKINYYAKFNFTSFMNVIDALGGITVDVPKYEVIGRDDGVFVANLHDTIKPGINHFNALGALDFVRERYSFKAGDIIRGQNQLLMMKAVIKKCTTPSIVTKLDGVFETLSSSFETNMASDDIKSLINMQIDDMASWDIQSYHIIGNGGKRVMNLATVGDVSSVNKNGLYVMIPNKNSIKKASNYISTVINGKDILKVVQDIDDSPQ